jgi:hypothetical protein
MSGREKKSIQFATFVFLSPRGVWRAEKFQTDCKNVENVGRGFEREM